MLILEAPSKCRAAFSGCSVHIGGFSLTAGCSIGGEQALMDKHYYQAIKNRVCYQRFLPSMTSMGRASTSNPSRHLRFTEILRRETSKASPSPSVPYIE